VRAGELVVLLEELPDLVFILTVQPGLEHLCEQVLADQGEVGEPAADGVGVGVQVGGHGIVRLAHIDLLV
jgi:hypothetical protein